MKFVNKYLIALASLAVIFASCEDAPDDVMDAGAPGAIPTMSGSSAALLGGTVAGNFTIIESSLSLKFDIVEDAAGITEVIVKKSFNGGAEVEVARFSSWPFTYSLSTPAEFNEGVNPSGVLELGDNFTFSTYMVTGSGEEVHYVSNSLSVTVACPSDIAGTYETSCNGAGGPMGPNGGRLVEITEVAGKPGVYEVSDVSCLGFGPGDPAQICGIFTDVCGVITVSAGSDDCNFGVPTTGTGSVAEVGGNTVITITWENSVGSSDLTYVKQ